MPGRIYLQNENANLIPMEETSYESEKFLQEILAKHHDLLAGEQINSDEPRRWLLVTREMSVPGEQDGNAKWSLDHLFLDQDAVPTLVEVKRSTDHRIRRKVVGQMLDYAANAVAYWPVEEIRAKFENSCEKNDEDPEEQLANLLGEGHDFDEFWQRVKTNLQAGRIRMVFLADSIPVELRRIVEFLNEQMDPAEVLAVEIKQFVGEGIKTFVPRVLGQSETARQKKSGAQPGKKWDEPTFMAALEQECGLTVRNALEDLLHWLAPQMSEVWYGAGSKQGGIVAMIKSGSTNYHICRLVTQGKIVFLFDALCKRPPFTNEGVRTELLAKINEIPGVDCSDNVLATRAKISFKKLTSPAALDKLKAALGWLIEKVKAEGGTFKE